jgi:hypothetical protein
MMLPYFHYYRMMEDVKKKSRRIAVSVGAPAEAPDRPASERYARSQFRAGQSVNPGLCGSLPRNR